MIPRLLHWVWLGSAPIPADHAAWIAGWQELHPAWETRVWCEADVPPLRNHRQFDAASSWAQRADIVRYELLLRHGGVYLDTDVECVRPLDSLVEQLGEPAGFAGLERPGLLGNAVLGAEPGHPWMASAVDALPESMDHEFLTLDQTGPGFLTRITAGRDDVMVLGPEAFYPVTSAGEVNTIGPSTYAVHHFAKSWLHVENHRIVSAAADAAMEQIPEGTTFVLVGGGLTLDLPGRIPRPFIERDGLDMGVPADDEHAVAELEQIRRRGSEWVVFLPTAFWWLEFYPRLLDTLRALSIERREDDTIALFRLPGSATCAEA